VADVGLPARIAGGENKNYNIRPPASMVGTRGTRVEGGLFSDLLLFTAILISHAPELLVLPWTKLDGTYRGCHVSPTTTPIEMLSWRFHRLGVLSNFLRFGGRGVCQGQEDPFLL
jgi:hypothetical protein